MFEIKLDHSGGNGKDGPPWKYSKNLQNIFRDACSQRMQMLPYIYSASNISYKNGVMMKPLAFEYPNDKNTFDIWNEYLFGNSFLVAPIYDSSSSRSIYLPEGKWYDFNDLSKTYKGGESINVSVTLDKIPVFVKSNSIYVTGNIYQGSDEIWNKNNDIELSIHIFPGTSGEKSLYNYVDLNDSDNEKNITVKNENGKVVIHAEPIKLNSKILIKSEIKPSSVSLNDSKVKFKWTKDTGIIETELNKETQANIEVHYK